MVIRERVALAPRTTLGVGGEARYFAEAESEGEVAEALAWAGERGIGVVVIGAGSNLLVADRGVDGLVLRVRVRGVRERDKANRGTIEVDVGAGEAWDDFVSHAVAKGWAGIECLSGIPGDVGATPIQNVGAYGQEVSETITQVRAVERGTGRIVEIASDACGFGYRDSVFKREDKDRYVIVAVTFALRPGGLPAVRYAELAKALSGRGEVSLAEVRETVIGLRRRKSMVLDPADENGKSAGSFFTNALVTRGEAEAVRRRVEEAGVLGAGESMPEFPGGEGRVKLSAAWLIERAGFAKGTYDGAVGLSTRHTLAVVNRGGATAAEVVAFAKRVKRGVRERFGVELTPEPVMVGFAPGELAGLTTA